MKHRMGICAIGVMLLAGAAVAEPVPAWVEEARQRVQPFATDLQADLKAAIEAGGVVNGIKVCQSAAPAVAQAHAKAGWTVTRTALKIRNPDNAPSAWQRAQLEAMQAAPVVDGRPAERWREADENGIPVREYLRAIPTQAVCLGCHGAEVSAEVREVLAQRYPQDEATGFALGELRGAFVVRYLNGD